MAVRVRELAKQLQRTPDDVLGILHAIGLRRFASIDEKLSPDAEKKLRLAIARGEKPLRREPVLSGGRSELEQLAEGMFGHDLMAGLIDGGPHRSATREPEPVALTARKSATPLPERAPEPVAARPPTADDAVRLGILESRERKLEVDLDHLHLERAKLAELRAQLQTDRDTLSHERMLLDQRSAELDHQQDRLVQWASALKEEEHAAREAGAHHHHHFLKPLREALEQRGLRGHDEFERALAALASVHKLRDLLSYMRVENAVDGFLAEQLLLVGANAPVALEGTAYACVQVAPDRVELPTEAGLQKLGSKLSDSLLLRGAKRLRIVGAPLVWAKLLREVMDVKIKRIEVLPHVERTLEVARHDIEAADVIVLADVTEQPAARELFDTSRAIVLRTTCEPLERTLNALIAALEHA